MLYNCIKMRYDESIKGALFMSYYTHPKKRKKAELLSLIEHAIEQDPEQNVVGDLTHNDALFVQDVLFERGYNVDIEKEIDKDRRHVASEDWKLVRFKRDENRWLKMKKSSQKKFISELKKKLKNPAGHNWAIWIQDAEQEINERGHSTNLEIGSQFTKSRRAELIDLSMKDFSYIQEILPKVVPKKEKKDAMLNVRVAKDDLELLKKSNVDVAELVRHSLKKALKEIKEK